MVHVEREDALVALKRFSSIAKQNLLVSSNHPNADEVRLCAQARREIYSRLIDEVTNHGVAHAYQLAIREYVKLPVSHNDDNNASRLSLAGYAKALELALQAFGVTEKNMVSLRVARQTSRAQTGPARIVETA